VRTIAQKDLRESGSNEEIFRADFGGFARCGGSSCAIIDTNAHDHPVLERAREFVRRAARRDPGLRLTAQTPAWT
jgi:hypothetical protein